MTHANIAESARVASAIVVERVSKCRSVFTLEMHQFTFPNERTAYTCG